MQTHCKQFPNKKRWGKHNREGARQRVQELQRKLRRNFRIYKCESCGGYHITSLDLKEYEQIMTEQQQNLLKLKVENMLFQFFKKRDEANQTMNEASEIIAPMYEKFDKQIREELIPAFEDIFYKEDRLDRHAGPWGRNISYEYDFTKEGIYVTWSCWDQYENEEGEFTIPIHFLWDDTAIATYAKEVDDICEKKMQQKKENEKVLLEAKIAELQKKVVELESTLEK